MLKSRIADHIVDIVGALRNEGYETYVVGGAVRDILNDRAPKDYDISTSATPEQVREVFGRKRTIQIGRRFRIIHLRHGREVIEISTFRKDPPKNKANDPPRRPNSPEKLILRDNEFGSPEEDAWRRDFTVNSIFYDPIEDRLVDHTGMGLDDLKAGLIRLIGDPNARFEEDPVRVLRALKLVGQYGFHLEEDTKSALERSIPLIEHCSPSRLSLEMTKILQNPYGDRILSAFHDYEFLGHFLPHVENHWHTRARSHMLTLLAERNRRVREGLYRDSLSLAMAVIALPFAELELSGDEPGSLWEHQAGVDVQLRQVIRNVFHPHCFAKRVTAAATKILLVQPKFHSSTNPKSLLRHPAYCHGREIMLIQNDLIWNDDALSERWPWRGERTKRRRKRRNPRRRRKN